MKTPEFEITNEDCADLLSRSKDNEYDLAIVDVPYGINAEQGTNRASRRQFKDKEYGWDNGAPSKEYWIDLFRVSKNQIIWGANHFIEDIPNANSKHWIIWDKKNPDRCFADCEMAWGSNMDNARIPNLRRVQELNRGDYGKIHPTQKPVALYEWLFKNYAKEGQKILDTHLGSGSIAIALHRMNQIEKMNLHLTACELDEDYYNDAIKRIKNQTKQLTIF